MLEVGIIGHKEIIVTPEMSAAKVGSGLLDVFATPVMVAQMEETCHTSISGELAPGQTTVGIKMEVSHLAATPIGLPVRFESRLVAIDRRKLTFQVSAFDQLEQIGAATHERFIVDAEKFMAKVQQKTASATTFN